MPDPIGDWKEHLGRKVSLRFRLHDDDHPFSEAIGVVSAADAAGDDQTITILTKRGESKQIPVRDIVAAKLFPG